MLCCESCGAVVGPSERALSSQLAARQCSEHRSQLLLMSACDGWEGQKLLRALGGPVCSLLEESWWALKHTGAMSGSVRRTGSRDGRCTGAQRVCCSQMRTWFSVLLLWGCVWGKRGTEAVFYDTVWCVWGGDRFLGSESQPLCYLWRGLQTGREEDRFRQRLSVWSLLVREQENL